MKIKPYHYAFSLPFVLQEKSIWRRFYGLFLISLLVITILPQHSYGKQIDHTKKVLILYSYGSDIPAQTLFTQGLRSKLGLNSTAQIDYVYEYLEMGRYASNEEYEKSLSEFLKGKYAMAPPDLIITHFMPAGNFMIQYGEKTFPGVPTVLAFYEGEEEEHPNLPANYFDVTGTYGVTKAVQIILDAQQSTQKIYVVVGDSERERMVVKKFQDEVASFAGKVELVYLNKLSFDQMLETIKEIDGNSAILYLFLFKDIAGNSFIPGEALKQMYQVARVPIYGSVSVFIGQGAVGGYMASQELFGKKVGTVGSHVLQGNLSTYHPDNKTLMAEYIFDWRELKRWGIDEKKLPPGSKILYREPSIWEAYRWHVVGAVLLIIVEATMLILLLINRNRRKKAEQKSLVLNSQLVENIKVQQEINATLEEEIMERHATEESLQETRAILQAALDNCQAGIAIVDAPDGKLRYLNKAGMDITDASKDLFSINLKESLAHENIFHEDGRQFEKYENPLVKAIVYGETSSCECVIRREGLKNIALWANAAPIKADNGKVTAGIVIFLDISERKSIEEALRNAKEEAERANVAKSQFLANMSHEIRTPMNGIIGMTDITLMTNLDGKQREYLTIVKNSTMALLRVLNDILDYTKIEAGKIDMEETVFDVREITNDVIELFNVTAQQKGLSITLSLGQEIPTKIIGDVVRLRQILSNLVGNGVKFTNHGRVAIHIGVVEKFEHKVKLNFVIKDTGIGIADEKLDKLFKRFSQVDDSNTRQFGGTGLGLAISKKLIEIMGGKIGVESKEGVGSSFFFTAVFGTPEQRGEEENQQIHSELLHTENISGKTVLLAEDDLVSRNMVTIFLKNNGFNVIAVENGQEAIMAWEQGMFHIILMDVNMPYMDGYSATQTIRLQEKNKNSRIPIIAMTAYALKGDREKCLESGMDDYISKPINFGQVLEIIRKYMK